MFFFGAVFVVFYMVCCYCQRLFAAFEIFYAPKYIKINLCVYIYIYLYAYIQVSDLRTPYGGEFANH